MVTVKIPRRTLDFASNWKRDIAVRFAARCHTPIPLAAAKMKPYLCAPSTTGNVDKPWNLPTMNTRRPTAMRMPRHGGRAQYRPDYKEWLDEEFRKSSIRRRCNKAHTHVRSLSDSLSRAEKRLHRSALSPDELRRHIRDRNTRAKKLQRTAPKPPPVQSWSAMRTLEMGAYKKQLSSFHKWDDKMRTFIQETKAVEHALNKLGKQKNRRGRACRRADARY